MTSTVSTYSYNLQPQRVAQTSNHQIVIGVRAQHGPNVIVRNLSSTTQPHLQPRQQQQAQQRQQHGGGGGLQTQAHGQPHAAHGHQHQPQGPPQPMYNQQNWQQRQVSCLRLFGKKISKILIFFIFFLAQYEPFHNSFHLT